MQLTSSLSGCGYSAGAPQLVALADTHYSQHHTFVDGGITLNGIIS